MYSDIKLGKRSLNKKKDIPNTQEAPAFDLSMKVAEPSMKKMKSEVKTAKIVKKKKDEAPEIDLKKGMFSSYLSVKS